MSTFGCIKKIELNEKYDQVWWVFSNHIRCGSDSCWVIRFLVWLNSYKHQFVFDINYIILYKATKERIVLLITTANRLRNIGRCMKSMLRTKGVENVNKNKSV